MSLSLQELSAFLQERTLFKILPARVLEGISKAFQVLTCGPGQLVFKQGDLPEALYFVHAGSVEVIQGSPPKVVAYLTPGDCFGEMSLLQNKPHNATIRVPEEAVILSLSRKSFEELQSYFPEITKELTTLMNRRLDGGNTPVSPGLQGNLAFFDLPTVIQTVAGSRQTGLLSLRGRNNKVVAQVYIKQGHMTYANFGHLSGDVAIFELLTRNEPLDFVFEQNQSLEAANTPDKTLSSRDPSMLLIEGARRADELPKLMRELNWPSGIFRATVAQPDLSKLPPETTAIARRISLLLDVGLPISALTEKLAYDRYAILSTLDAMQKAGFIKAAEPKSAASAESIHNPARIASMVNAINELCQSLGYILGKEKIRQMLEQSLQESTSRYTNLSSLRIHPEITSLDLRMARPDVSQSQTSEKALVELTYNFLRLVAENRI